MLMKILISSLLVSGAFALSDKCNSKKESCMPKEYSPEFPGTPEELESFCKNAIEFLECVFEPQSPCENPSERGLRELKDAIPVLKRVCDKETALYKDLEEILPCLKTLTENRDMRMRCHNMQMKKDALEKFEKLLLSEGVTNVTEEESYCLESLFMDTCMTAALGANCGAKTRDVSADLLEMFTAAVGDNCYAGLNGKLADIVRAMELEYLESEEVEELIKAK